MTARGWCLLMVSGCLLAGCATGRQQAPLKQNAESVPGGSTNAAPGCRWHSVVIQPPPRQVKPNFWSQFNPVWWFKNQDDPVPPAWYRPQSKWRRFLWHLRNPLHNFHFYVIGIADKTTIRSGRYPGRVSNPNGGWNFAVSKYKCLRLPFISYQRGRFNFYFGWRERGNFGIKLNFEDRRSDEPRQPVKRIRKPANHKEVGPY